MTPNTPQRGTAVLLLLCLAQFMVVLDLSIVSVALRALREALEFSEQNLQYVISLYALTFGAFLILAGRAGDLLGRRRFFMVGMGVFALSSLVGGLAQSQGVLLAARAVQGLGAAAMIPAALSLITSIFAEGAERDRALGMWGGASGIGGLIGFILGGVLIDLLSWNWVFFVNTLIGLIALVAARTLLPQSEERGEGGSLDLRGAVTLAVGLALLIYGLTRGQEQGFTAPLPLGLFGGAFLSLVVFVLIESRVREPLVPFRIFRERTLTGANLVGLLLSAVLAGEGFFASLYMQGVLGYSALQTGLALIPQNICFFVSARVAATLVERFGFRPVLMGGLALVGAGCLYLTGVDLQSSFWINLLPGFVLLGLGIGSTLVTSTISATAGVQSREQGLASGLISTSQQIGAAIGIAVLVTIAGTQTNALGGADDLINVVSGYRVGLLVAAGIALLGVLVAAIMIRGRPTTDVETSN